MKTKRQAAVDCPIQFVNFIFLITISLYNNQEIILKTHHRWWATKRCCSNESPHGNDQIILNCGLSSIFLIEVTSIEGYKVGHFSSEIHINVNFPFRIFCFCFLFFLFFLNIQIWVVFKRLPDCLNFESSRKIQSTEDCPIFEKKFSLIVWRINSCSESCLRFC